MLIRSETSADHVRVAEITRLAFRGHQEVKLLDHLRQPGLLICSLVAVDARDQICGHALFSRVFLRTPGGDLSVASLAPMAVLPEMQRHGVGSALVRHGIKQCRRGGETAIIVVGHPDFYSEFGFSREVVRHLASPYAGEAFMGLELVSGALTGTKGEIVYPEAFAAFA
jgi:putative acetyltransferase